MYDHWHTSCKINSSSLESDHDFSSWGSPLFQPVFKASMQIRYQLPDNKFNYSWSGQHSCPELAHMCAAGLYQIHRGRIFSGKFPQPSWQWILAVCDFGWVSTFMVLCHVTFWNSTFGTTFKSTYLVASEVAVRQGTERVREKMRGEERGPTEIGKNGYSTKRLDRLGLFSLHWRRLRGWPDQTL